MFDGLEGGRCYANEGGRRMMLLIRGSACSKQPESCGLQAAHSLLELHFRQFWDQAIFRHKDHKEKTEKTLRALRLRGEISCIRLKKAKLQLDVDRDVPEPDNLPVAEYGFR